MSRIVTKKSRLVHESWICQESWPKSVTFSRIVTFAKNILTLQSFDNSMQIENNVRIPFCFTWHVIMNSRATIGYTRYLGGPNRVPFYFRDRNNPRTPSEWPTSSTTRRWPHFRRVDPILATETPKGARLFYPTTPKWPGCSTSTAQRPATLSLFRYVDLWESLRLKPTPSNSIVTRLTLWPRGTPVVVQCFGRN